MLVRGRSKELVRGVAGRRRGEEVMDALEECWERGGEARGRV